MKNTVKNTVAGAILQAQAAIPGLVAHGTALGLVRVKHDTLTAKVTDLIMGRDDLDEAKADLREARTTQTGQVKGGRIFARTAREVIRPHLFDAPPEVLAQAGFEGSMAIPTKPDALLQMMQRLKGYFEENTTHQNEALNVNAARANTFATDIANAVVAVNQKKAAVGVKRLARDEKLKAVQDAIRNLISELHMVLSPTDYLWEEFGLKRPGILQTPDVPENVVALVIGSNAVAVKWDAAARARGYRIYKKVVGVDTEFLPVDSRTDLDYVIEGLPSNARIEIAVSATNNGGESALSEVVVITTA